MGPSTADYGSTAMKPSWDAMEGEGGANPSLGSLVHDSDCSIQDFGQCFSLLLASPSVCTLPLHLHLYLLSHSLSALIATDDDLCNNKSKYLAKNFVFSSVQYFSIVKQNFHLCLLPVLAMTLKEFCNFFFLFMN